MRAAILALAVASTCACSVEAPAPREEVARDEARTIADGAADGVFGQPDMNTDTRPTQVSILTVTAPAGLATDGFDGSADALWISDAAANRLLARHQITFDAIDLRGQPTYGDSLPNAGQIDVNGVGFDRPGGVAYSLVSGEWLVADTGNHRVLRGYSGANAWMVFGQHGDLHSNTPNESGISATSLSSPKAVAFRYGAGVYVADAGNHRLLGYGNGTDYASYVFGQADMASGAPNRGLAHAAGDSLNDPEALAVALPAFGAPWQGLWIADTGNHRVLHVPFGAAYADIILGQPDAVSNQPQPASAYGFDTPTGLALDPLGGLWVADTRHFRVVHFPRGATKADRVLGQPDFVHGDAPTTTSATTLWGPIAVAVGWNGDVYVADAGASRVLRYHFTCASAADCDDHDPCTDDICTPNGCAHVLSSYSTTCAPYLCDLSQRQCAKSCSAAQGCQQAYLCLGGSCVLRCSRDADCKSVVGHGSCRDGLCCDRDCRGLCESCNEPGSEGTCRPVDGAPRPDPVTFAPRSCPAADADCAGQCDGIHGAACEPTFSGSPCGFEGCVDGVARSRGQCDGVGTCVSASHSCGAYACLPAGCTTSCEADRDCAAGAYCVSGACVMAGLAPAGGGCAIGARSDDDATPLAMVVPALALALSGVARKARRALGRRR